LNTYTIVLERIGTGEHALSMVTRQKDETVVRAYAEAAIAQSSDLRIAEIHARTSDASPMERGRDHHAMISRYRPIPLFWPRRWQSLASQDYQTDEE
jgi:hypothetical protein